MDHTRRGRNIQRFQNILVDHGLYMTDESPKPTGFLISFPLRYYDNGFTGGRLGNTRLFGDVNAWNYRLQKVRVRFLPRIGTNVLPPSRSVAIYIAQAGIVENLDFFERRRASGDSRRLRTYNLDNYVRYDSSDLGNSGGSPYLLFSFAEQDGYPDEKDLPTASNMAGRFWSPFTSRWLLQFNPTNDFEIENIDDILIEMTLTTGQPSCPREMARALLQIVARSRGTAEESTMDRVKGIPKSGICVVLALVLHCAFPPAIAQERPAVIPYQGQLADQEVCR